MRHEHGSIGIGEEDMLRAPVSKSRRTIAPRPASASPRASRKLRNAPAMSTVADRDGILRVELDAAPHVAHLVEQAS